jgi:hypothetical protein
MKVYVVTMDVGLNGFVHLGAYSTREVAERIAARAQVFTDNRGTEVEELTVDKVPDPWDPEGRWAASENAPSRLLNPRITEK